MSHPHMPIQTTLPDLLTQVTPTAAAQVAHWYRPSLGYRAGSFIESLIGTIALADLTNRALLGLAFPEYVAAVTVAADHPGGIEELALIASRR